MVRFDQIRSREIGSAMNDEMKVSEKGYAAGVVLCEEADCNVVWCCADTRG
jgi:hypothetical protein